MKIEDFMLHAAVAYSTVDRKNDYGWDSNPCPKQPKTHTGFVIAANLLTLSTQDMRKATIPALYSSRIDGTILFHQMLESSI